MNLTISRTTSFAITISLLLATSAAAQERQPSTPGIYRAGQAAIIAANTADVLTTIHSRSVGHHELNPLIGDSTGRLVLAKSLGTAGTLALMYVLKKTGHPTAAGWIGLGSSTLPALAAVHNERLARQ